MYLDELELCTTASEYKSLINSRIVDVHISVYAALSQLQSNKLCKYTYVCANVQTNVHILKLQIELVSESLEHTRCFYAAKT